MIGSSRIFAATLLLMVTACATAPNLELYFTPYDAGILEGSGLVIEAEDKSFKLTAGRFVPPFQTDPMTPIVWTSIYSDRRPDNVGPPSESVLMSGGRSSPTASLIDSYDFALQNGARRVVVTHPASSKPLYGVLLLNKRHVASTGAAARSYLIRVPDEYVKAAQGGRVSVVYEPVGRSDRSGVSMYGWVLWLSDSPLR